MATEETKGREQAEADGKQPDELLAEANETIVDLHAQLQELRALRENDVIREEAQAIKGRFGYPRDGRLTPEMLDALQSLLEQPIPARYISVVEQWSQSYKTRSGEEKPWPPFTMTGIKNPQVQVDRMNTVLGRAHWRVLKSYADAGQVCHVFVVVGNDLGKARIVDGQLDENGAEVISSEEGWGQYGKGADKGNHFKGSETNAIKRVIARIGPGAEVYRLEADTDTQPDDTEAPPPDAPAPVVGGAAAPDPEAEIAALLEGDDPLIEKRRELNELMVKLEVQPLERARVLIGTQDEKELDKLIKRATDSVAASGEESQEPPPEAEQPELG